MARGRVPGGHAMGTDTDVGVPLATGPARKFPPAPWQTVKPNSLAGSKLPFQTGLPSGNCPIPTDPQRIGASTSPARLQLRRNRDISISSLCPPHLFRPARSQFFNCYMITTRPQIGEQHRALTLRPRHCIRVTIINHYYRVTE